MRGRQTYSGWKVGSVKKGWVLPSTLGDGKWSYAVRMAENGCRRKSDGEARDRGLLRISCCVSEAYSVSAGVRRPLAHVLLKDSY